MKTLYEVLKFNNLYPITPAISLGITSRSVESYVKHTLEDTSNTWKQKEISFIKIIKLSIFYAFIPM